MWHLDQDMAICSQTLPLCSIMQQYFIIYQIPATTYKKKSGQKVAWKKCTEKSDVVDQFISARGKKFWDVDLDWFEEYCVMDQDISWGTGYDNRDMRELEGCYTIFLFRHNITKKLQYHNITISQYGGQAMTTVTWERAGEMLHYFPFSPQYQWGMSHTYTKLRKM